MRKLHLRGNRNEIKFSFYWSATDQIFEMDAGLVSHQRRYTAKDEETNIHVSYAPNAMSIFQLADKTKVSWYKLMGESKSLIFLHSLSWVYL